MDGPTPDAAQGLYERDFHAWATAQAAAIREAAAGRPAALDWENIAEEIESLGRSQRDAVESRVVTIVVHLLKLACARDAEPRRVWSVTVVGQRARLRRLLKNNPSLRAQFPEIVTEAAQDAGRQAAQELKLYGDDHGAVEAVLRAASHTPDEILNDWWPDPPSG